MFKYNVLSSIKIKKSINNHSPFRDDWGNKFARSKGNSRAPDVAEAASDVRKPMVCPEIKFQSYYGRLFL